MAKPKKQKTKEKRIMNTAGSDSATTGINALTETQKRLESLLVARQLVVGAIAKRNETTDAARTTRVAKLVTDVTNPNPQIETLTKAACTELKALEDNARQILDSLECAVEHFRKAIDLSEKENCSDWIAVYQKELAEFRQSDAQKLEIEKKIEQLQECCDEQKSAAR